MIQKCVVLCCSCLHGVQKKILYSIQRQTFKENMVHINSKSLQIINARQ